VYAHVDPAIDRSRRGVLHRCGGHQCPPQGCEQVRQDGEQEQLDRAPAGTSHRTAVPRSVYQTIASPGRPLDSAVHHSARAWFGADFSTVRIHTDAAAARSAHDVDAHAYTVGDHVVFAAGRYQPDSDTGRHTLAHELTHVLQQRASGATHRLPLTISDPAHDDERQAETLSDAALSGNRASTLTGVSSGQPGTIYRQAPTTTTFSSPANVCSPQQTRALVPAVTNAQRWLNYADIRLSWYAAAPTSPIGRAAGQSVLRHFAASDARTVRYVQNIIRLVANRLRTDPSAPNPLTVQCHGGTDPSCGHSGAYVQGNLLVFCPSMFRGDPAEQAMGVIHEIVHSIIGPGPMHITDRAYRQDRLYGRLSPGEALTNAESYAMLVRDLAVGRVSGTAPRDTFEDCPGWQGALATAIGRAQRWNRDAEVLVHDRRPGLLSQWTALATTYLGGESPAQVAAAATVYDGAKTRLQEPVDFECEPAGGGRCDRSSTYWYSTGDFHICPSWRNRATDDDRAEALLVGLYGYFGLVDDNQRRVNLARLARAIHFQFWAPPTAADVSAALTAAAATPQPAAAPPPGPVPRL